MKRLFFVLLGLLIISTMAVVIISHNDRAATPQVNTNVTPTIPATPTLNPGKIITFGNEQFMYSYFIVQNPSDLALIPNFSHPKDVETLMTENNCVSAINGGFYDKSSKPLGYFRSDDKVFGSRIDSDLVNGFVWGDASGAAVISTDLTFTNYRFAVQTGPVLLFDSKALPLAINNDTGARRMIAAKNDTLIFLTVYNGDSVYDGPKLTDLPGIIQAISQKENLNIADAINLDGGSASAFYMADTKLSELTPVGSLFCLK